MEGTMQAFVVDAEWAPKAGYTLTERERRDKRAFRSDMVYRNLKTGLKQAPIPAIGPDDVLIRVGACGVCGSDLHALRADDGGYSKYAAHLRLPVITGHEYSGEIVEVGKNVTGLRVGDLVAAEQIRWCGRCRSCRTGMFNQCEELEEAGLSCDGGFAEYALLPAKYCCVINRLANKLGDKMAALEAGALAEPTAVAYSGMQINGGGVKPGANVAVFGTGPIGLAAVALARAFGAATIFAFGTNPARDGLAAAMGADVVANPNDLLAQGSSAGALVLEKTDGIGAGMIVEATGNFSSVYPEIIKCVGNGARVIQLGVGATPAMFNAMPVLRKNVHIIGSLGHAGSDIFPSVLRMMEAGGLDMRKMVTGRYRLDDAPAGIAASGDRTKGHGKILISQHY
ncbi:MAG: alcohol dehydrogenase catalytic domain-containing protein [Planctomycetaceae bacterium]|nr:alcohol dehydrogenase catalytic domain-containing protein [Planctomycetaceae bacterium]